MIRTDAEYRRALAQLSDEADTLRRQREALAGAGLSASEVDRAMEPLLSFRAQLQDEVDAYNQMRHGDLGVLSSLRGIGRWLIGARIARGLSQADLAEQLSVDPSQVSRDERNDYRGVSVDRAQRIMEALGVRFTAEADRLLEPDPEAASTSA